MPLNESHHSIEAKRGFSTMAALMVSKENKDADWLVESVFTNPDYRGQGLARELIEYVQKEYGDFKISSENDPFWEKMGYEEGKDGFWRQKR